MKTIGFIGAILCLLKYLVNIVWSVFVIAGLWVLREMCGEILQEDVGSDCSGTVAG
jgi:hypothetical protein